MSFDNETPTSKWFTIKTTAVGTYDIVYYIVDHDITTDFAAWIVENLKTVPTCKFWRLYAEELISAIERNSPMASFNNLQSLRDFLARANKHMKKLYACYQHERVPTSN